MIWAKRIGKWFLIALATLITLLLILAIVIYFCEDKIKAYAVARINQNLNTEIKVSEIDLTIWSSFPYASIDFKDVLIMDPITVNKLSDTMLYAKKLSFEFSVWDITSGNYSVKQIRVQDAAINLYIDEKGNENYHFWKDSKEKSDEKFEFNLENVIIENTHISYVNKHNEQNYSFFTRETKLSGDFKEKTFDLNTNADLFVNHFYSGKIALLKKKQSHLDLNIHVDIPKDKLTFKTGKLKIEDLLLGITGWIGIGDTTTCDLGVKTNKVELESIYRIFPKNFSEHLQHYDSKGEVKVDASIKGEISTTASPILNIDFSVVDGSMKEKESGVVLKKLHFKGHYTNFNENETDEVILPELSGKFLDGSFKASLGVRNFKDPKIKLDLKGDFNLVTLHKFLRPKNIEEMSGELKASIHMLTSIDAENQTLDLISASGTARVKKGKINSKSLALNLTDLQGLLEIKNMDASIEGLSGKKGESDFEINGVIKNFMPYALKKNQHINIVASLVSENIRLEDFISTEQTHTENQSTGYYTFPATINFNLDASVEKLTYGAFTGKKIKGNFKLLDKFFTASKLEVRMAGGKCNGKLTVDGTSDKGFLIETKQQLEEVNIDQVFALFEDFGQKEITSKNISGKLNAEIDFFGFMDPQLNLHSETVTSTSKLELKNGELNDFLLLTDVVKYMRDVKYLVAIIKKKNLDRLEKQVKNIKFETLSNTIEIRNEEILIPSMKLESNVMDLNIAGSHKFNNDIDYQLNFRLKDLKLDSEDPEVKAMDDGKGFRVFLRITGNVSDPQYEFDKKAFKNNIKEKLQSEKNDVKSILKAELGIFKKDSLLKKQETPKEEVKFLYEWDEEKTTESTETTPEEKKEQERKRTKKQKEKTLVTDKKEEVKFTFEEE
jgi:uncharacterized protein involved in outer membrane biogenesis